MDKNENSKLSIGIEMSSILSLSEKSKLSVGIEISSKLSLSMKLKQKLK